MISDVMSMSLSTTCLWENVTSVCGSVTDDCLLLLLAWVYCGCIVSYARQIRKVKHVFITQSNI